MIQNTKGCFFCERNENGKDVVLVATVLHEPTQMKLRLCHRCFNQAVVCSDGLKWGNKKVALYRFPRTNRRLNGEEA